MSCELKPEASARSQIKDKADLSIGGCICCCSSYSMYALPSPLPFVFAFLHMEFVPFVSLGEHQMWGVAQPENLLSKSVLSLRIKGDDFFFLFFLL